MANTTNVPQPTFGPLGFIAPTEAAILNGATLDINTAFGGNVNPALTTPQGQLASSLAAIIGFVNDTFLYYTTQTDPTTAQGRMQDAIGEIYFIYRLPSQPTIVSCICTGLPNIQIPAGSLAVDTNGLFYASVAAATIGLGGTVTVSFANVLPGPTPCPAGALNQIYNSISGWDTISNPSAGVLGVNVETQAAFEARRRLSVAQNSLGSLPSILGSVLSVPGVLDAYVTENTSNISQTIGGVSLLPNSLYVAVVGGTPMAVATAIWAHKAPGCAYNGNTTVTIQDTSTGYVPPYPTYSVTFEIPMALQIFISVIIANTILVPSNAASLIQNAIIGAFVGKDGGQPVAIGTPLFSSRFYSTVAALGTWAQIYEITLGSINAGAASFTGSITSTLMTVTAVTSGTIAANQYLVDMTGQIIAGTLILSQASGTPGGIGTYNLNNALTVTTEAIVSVVPTLFEVVPNINQIPAVSANNIIVTFH
jgi:hypothetical protein